MTHPWIAWLTGKDEGDSRAYDFIAERPFWKTWWFRISIVIACIILIIFFRPWNG